MIRFTAKKPTFNSGFFGAKQYFSTMPRHKPFKAKVPITFLKPPFEVLGLDEHDLQDLMGEDSFVRTPNDVNQIISGKVNQDLPTDLTFLSDQKWEEPFLLCP